MDWGIHLPHLGRQATRRNLIEFAQLAEALGFHSGWVSDHIAWPKDIASRYPYTDDGSFAPPMDMPWLDPIGTMFFVAGCTERLKLAPTVLILGYRPPVLTAKAIASLDVLSEGRAILGIGVGWMREEFEVLGMPYDHRGKRADEQLALFERFFAEAEPSFHGEYYDVPDGRFRAQAVQRPRADLGRRRHRAGVPADGALGRRVPCRVPEGRRGRRGVAADRRAVRRGRPRTAASCACRSGCTSTRRSR